MCSAMASAAQPAIPKLGSPSPELVCACGQTFTAPIQAVQELRDADGVHFSTIGYASHDPDECPLPVNGTRCWEIWSADEEAAA
jgi:hypothetical protein